MTSQCLWKTSYATWRFHFNVIDGSFGFWYMPRIMKVFTITALLPRLNGLVQLLHNQHPHWRRQHMHEKNWSYSGISFTRCVLARFAMCLPGAKEQTSRPFDSE